MPHSTDVAPVSYYFSLLLFYYFIKNYKINIGLQSQNNNNKIINPFRLNECSKLTKNIVSIFRTDAHQPFFVVVCCTFHQN